MDYLITFEDGSTGYLAHYGVLGMKWGVWNDETAKRYGSSGLGIDVGAGGGGMLPEKESEMTEDEDMAEINKSYDLFWTPEMRQLASETDMATFSQASESSIFKGAAYNCATCSMMYDLRRRGYDVGANITTAASLIGYKDELEQFYSDVKVKTSFGLDYNFTRMQEKIKEEPDGARGMVWGQTTSGGGHAIVWSKENGKLVYRDCQSNKKYDERTVYAIYKDNQGKKSLYDKVTGRTTMGYVRLDNATPNIKNMMSNGLISKPTKKDTVQSRASDAVRTRLGEVNQIRRQRNRTQLPFTKKKSSLASDLVTTAKEVGKVVTAASNPTTYSMWEKQRRVRI